MTGTWWLTETGELRTDELYPLAVGLMVQLAELAPEGLAYELAAELVGEVGAEADDHGERSPLVGELAERIAAELRQSNLELA